jgi:hypothetical protein
MGKLVTGVCSAMLAGALLFGSADVWAFEITGACCVSPGRCVQATLAQCEGQDGIYVGDATTCENTDCERNVTAPLLSILALVATGGALTGLGVYRVLLRPRR